MLEQGRETLPVAITDLQRQKQINEEILAAIQRSLADPEGLPSCAKDEFEEEIAKTRRAIERFAAAIAVKESYAA